MSIADVTHVRFNILSGRRRRPAALFGRPRDRPYARMQLAASS